MILINYSTNTQSVNECLDKYASINEVLTFSPIFYKKREVKITKSSTFCDNSDHLFVYKFHQEIMKKLKFIDLNIEELRGKEEEIFSYEIFQKFGPHFLNTLIIQKFLKRFSKKQNIYFLADCKDGMRLCDFFLANNFKFKLILKNSASHDNQKRKNIFRGIKILMSNIIFFYSKNIFNQSPNKFENLISSLNNYRFLRKSFNIKPIKERYVSLNVQKFNGLNFQIYKKEIEGFISSYFPAFFKIKDLVLRDFKNDYKYFTSQNTTPVEIVKNILLGNFAKVFFYYDGSGIIDQKIYDLYKYTIPQTKTIKKLFWSKAQSENARDPNGIVVGCLSQKKLHPIKNIIGRDLILTSLTSSNFKRSLPVIQKTPFEMLGFLNDIAKTSEESDLKLLIKLHPSDYSNLNMYKESLKSYKHISFISESEEIPFKKVLINITFDTTMNISTIHKIPYQIIYNPINRPNLSTFFKHFEEKNFFFIDNEKILIKKILELKKNLGTYSVGNYRNILENFSDDYDTKIKDTIR